MHTVAIPLLLLTVIAWCATTTSALRTDGVFNFTRKPEDQTSDGYAVERGQFDYYHSTFAFTPKGEFRVVFSVNPTGGANSTSNVPREFSVSQCFYLVLCDVTDKVVRDYAYQMRRVLSEPNWKSNISSVVCDLKQVNRDCYREPLPARGAKSKTYRLPRIIRNRIFNIQLYACANCFRRAGLIGGFGDYSIQMTNPDLRFPHLGWDETVYPFAPTIFLALAIVIIGFAIFGISIAICRGIQVPFVAKVVFCTAALKIFSTSLTTAAYWHFARTGRVMVWFFVLRVPLIIADEIAIGLLMLVMSTGVGLMPAAWMFDRRSSTFAVFLGLALEVFTVVTSEVLFMFRFLGLIVFLFSGGTVAFICILYSWRNARFLAKYAELVQYANIHVGTTPLPRMALFFQVNATIVIAVWLFKVVSFGIMDHVLKRSDMLWVLFEAADIVLLSWYAFSVFPRRKSAYYVDMANVNNDRLREVSSWHLRNGPNAIDNDSELDNLNDEIVDVVGNVRRRSSNVTNTENQRDVDLEPPMIEWNSGDPLPSPNAGMWNMQEEMRRVLKRAKPPDAAPVRVLGSPSGDLGDSLELTVARPVLGPGTRKKEDRSGVVRSSQFADRQRVRVEDGTTSVSGFQSRELSAVSDFEYEPFSIPSSNASGDGVVFVAGSKNEVQVTRNVELTDEIVAQDNTDATDAIVARQSEVEEDAGKDEQAEKPPR